MTPYAGRRQRLLESVDVDAFLVVHLEGTDPDRASMQYLTGYPGYGALLLAPRETIALASRTNIGMARRAAPDLDWQILDWDYQKAISDVVRNHGIRQIGVAAKRMGLYTANALEAQTGITLTLFDDPTAALRVHKDESEIACIRRATQITERALETVLEHGVLGRTEAGISVELEMEMRRQGAEGLGFELIVSAGDNSALPHHRPSDRPVQQGDLLLFDIGARVDGYCSDITRVVSVGPAEDELQAVYDIVLAANRVGIASLRPGASGPRVDAAAREVIEAAGYGAQYAHGLSHGVGLEVHELPYSTGAMAVEAYEPGMVLTVEPGIYLPGLGGVRIEDLVVIRQDGCEVLSSFPKDTLRVTA